MRKTICLLITILLFSSLSFVEAKSGCCSHHKGVSHCGSNGKYICNDGTTSPSCTCGGPTYTTNSYTTSSYTTNSNTNSYTTNSYNIKDSYTKKCRNKFGNNSEYGLEGYSAYVAGYSAYDEKYCECTNGYILNSSNTACVSTNTVCQNKLGNNAKASSLTYSKTNLVCECGFGYALNKSKTSCISVSMACKQIYGDNAMESGSNCKCKAGYIWKGYTCVKKKWYQSKSTEVKGLPTTTSFSVKYRKA